MTDQALAELIGRAKAVLFDFDGPICSVFAGLPAPTVALDLRRHLSSQGIEVILDGPRAEDPLEVLRATVEFGADVVRETEDRLTAAEVAAVRTASPTGGGEASVRACTRAGLRPAIVSNNSAAAVNAYVAQHEIADLIGAAVVGRYYAKPHMMKPDPASLHAALRLLHIRPADAVFVGDSPADIEAARAAGVAVIGYANKPGKQSMLRGADVIIDDMHILAQHLTPNPA
jgi:phosphoglycolate phosphatase-like HAD superfamily hydrolase